MSLRIQRCDSPRELMLGGELDMATAPELKRVLGTISSDGDITLDLTFLRFVDNSGVQVLLATAARLDGTLVLYSPPDSLVRLLNLLRDPLPRNLILQVAGDDAPTRERPGSGRA